MSFPAPEPTDEDAPFWACVREGRLCLQRCGECGRYAHPPTSRCAYCGSTRREYLPAPACGVVFSYTVARTVAHASAEGRTPYAVVLVAFPECDGVRVLGSAPSIPIDALRIGLPVKWSQGAAQAIEFERG